MIMIKIMIMIMIMIMIKTWIRSPDPASPDFHRPFGHGDVGAHPLRR